MNNSAQTQLKMGYVWTICLVAACGGLLFGYDWVVIGGAKPFYEAWFSINLAASVRLSSRRGCSAPRRGARRWRAALTCS